MTEDIVHEATYPYPPEEVWRAITEPAALNAWLMQTDFREAAVGHRFEFRDKPRKAVGWDGVTRCEVLEVVPPRRFVFRFGDGSGGFTPTTVSWDLERTPSGGTHVRFRHSGFGGLKGWLMRQGMNQGWARMVARAIPFVIERRRATGAFPLRDEVKANARAPRA